MARVVVWPKREITGWNGEIPQPDNLDVFDVVDLHTALHTVYSTDAHFVPYWLEGEDVQPRINKEALPALAEAGVRMLFDVVVVEVDDPVAHDAEKPASAEWRAELLERLDRSPLRDSAGVYMTRGGARLLWILAEPVDRQGYMQTHGAVVAALAEVDIHVDPLFDWGRCYRLPFVVRDGRREDRWYDLDGLAHPLEIQPLSEAAAMAQIDRLRGKSKSKSKSTSLFAGVAESGRGPMLPEKITERRNVTLTSIAGRARAQGLAEDAIRALLTTVNAERCQPPLPQADVDRIARSIARYEAGPTALAVVDKSEPSAPPADVYQTLPDGRTFRFLLGSQVEIAAHARRDLEAGGIPTRYDRGKLWKYAEALGIWQEVDKVDVQKIVAGYDGERVIGPMVNGEVKLIPLKVSASLTSDCWELICVARSDTGFFDEAPAGLTLGNGFVSVDDGELTLREYRPGQRSTVRLDVAFEAGAKPHRFLRALEACWRDDGDREEKIATLRSFAGLALLGRATVLQKGIILVGAGANGKSMVQDVLTAMFPADAIASVAPQDLANEYRRARLSTARLNVVSEMPEAEILASEAVKAFLSGDRVEARYIRQDPFEYRPICGQLYSANALPGVRDTSHGFWRRWVLLTFNRVFTAEEQVRGLAEEIVREELGAIVSWALEGGAEALRRGQYREPPSSAAALTDWRASADQILVWLDENTEAGNLAEAWTMADALYLDYRRWAERSGHGVVSKTMLGKRLRQIGVEAKKTAAGNAYAVTITKKDRGLALVK